MIALMITPDRVQSISCNYTAECLMNSEVTNIADVDFGDLCWCWWRLMATVVVMVLVVDGAGDGCGYGGG